ncbi:MAG: exosortase T [Proteobacteria bacterium]|nr:exosortase T [Pseudomonadota bacterium]MCP4921475.1 exosortase T [Pseudomonadota bacterium]
MPRRRLALVLLLPGLVALVVEPATWLVGTWVHAGYDSVGAWVFVLCLMLAARSVWSGPGSPDPSASRKAIALLVAAAGIRLLGRLLDVNHVGALALALDAWALGLALRLGTRPWPVSPWRLAALFALSLPIKQLLQHFMGFPLRLTSTRLAGAVLAPFYPSMSVEGTFLTRPGVELSVDLPCSGAQGLFLLAVFAMAIATVRRIPSARGLALVVSVLLGALLANAARLIALFVGPTEALLAEPAHSSLGVACLAVGALPIAITALTSPALEPRTPLSGPSLQPHPAVTLLFSLACLLVAVAPGHPMDVSDPIVGRGLPTNLGALAGEDVPLEDKEADYFERFGGQVDKRLYGPHSALLVQTTMPVRHLHAPHDCLLGAGHTVTRLGVEPGHIPTTVYKTVDPDGHAWRVEASFVDPVGGGVATVSQVFWRWVQTPSGAWSLVERIHPWDLCEARPDACDAFDTTLFNALDLEA